MDKTCQVSLVRACSPVLASLEIVMQCASFDAKVGGQSWYARVASLSKIGDAPSSMKYSEDLKLLDVRVVQPVCPAGTQLKMVLE